MDANSWTKTIDHISQKSELYFLVGSKQLEPNNRPYQSKIGALLSFRIEARACFAVGLFDFSALDGFDTAITPIVRATAVIVVVVADTIPFVRGSSAFCGASRGWGTTYLGIQTLAFLAISLFDFPALNGFGTAITTIVRATAVVVVVVADTIPFVRGSSAFCGASRGSAATSLGIQTLTFFAVGLFDSPPLNSFSTAITAVVFATAVVVLVVTVAIALVLWKFAASFTATVAFIIGVQTFTLLAKFRDDNATVGLLATVTPVPVTSTIIVFIVTILVF